MAIFPEILLSSVVVTFMVIGIYMNQEDPALNEISRYHSEMVMSFATLVENKDGSTGGHIKRTTAYVKLLAEDNLNGSHTDKKVTDCIKCNTEQTAAVELLAK